MPLPQAQIEFSAEVARLVHEKHFRKAAQLVSDGCRLNVRVASDKPKDYLPPLQTFLHWLLNNGGMEQAARLLWTPAQFQFPQYTKDVWQLIDETSTGLIMGAASCSKCISPNELCRMADGTIRRAGDIKIGDLLAGDDGTARTVLDRHNGEAEMFRVVPTNGAPEFECNGDHILSLVCTWTKRNHGGRYGVSSGYTPGKVIDVSIREYLGWSISRKRAYRLFLRPAAMPGQPVKVDPYVYGTWLGDGTCIRAELTTPDGGMGDRWCEYWRELGFRVVNTRVGGGCNTWSVRGKNDGDSIWPNGWVRGSVVASEKRVKPEYLYNSESVRLAVLAGLIDADGTAHGGGFDITTKWKGLADDVETLAQSLGFFVTRSTREHHIKSTGFKADYEHIFISGDAARLPLREKTIKRISNRGLTAGFSTLSFTVEPVGRGSYAGFGVDGNHRFLLASGIVTHNSYGAGVRYFLEWIRDPEYTTVRLIGPSEDHLESNLFSHLVGLHNSASLPMPGEIGSLYIGLDRRNLIGSIKGLVIPVGRVKKAGRLQGTKRKPRQSMHPQFGDLSRLFILVDEGENVPGGLWSDIDNVLSNIDQVDSVGLKIFMAYNPTNQYDPIGVRAEPIKGWMNFDIERDYRWKSQRGWEVLRLDAERSENVVSGKIIFPGLQNRIGLERIAKNAGGVNSPGYMSMARGAYPTVSAEMTIIPAGRVPKCRGELIWYETPKSVGSVDMALEGGARAVFTVGKMGLATGVKLPPSLEHPDGTTVMFRATTNGPVAPRWCMQANQQIPLPKGDTVKMKEATVELARKAGIRPEHLCVDRTGNGAGVHDLMKNEWSSSVVGVNYSSGTTDNKKIMEEDDFTCDKMFDRIDSELWFALNAFLEFQVLWINSAMSLEALLPQLTKRLWKTVAGKKKVESKKDYKSRGNESPDEADSLTLFVHAARIGENIVPSMRGGSNVSEENDEWGPNDLYPGGSRVDVSNQNDTLLD